MALHTHLPIHKTGSDLLGLVAKIHAQMPRGYKRTVGDKIVSHCSEMLDLMALANATRNAERIQHIRDFLPARLDVRLNPSKTILQPVDRGVDFVGHVIKPWHRNTHKRTVNEAVRRIGMMPSDELLEVGNSYFGLLRQAEHSHHDRTRIANVLRDRGHTINGAITQTYRKAA